MITSWTRPIFIPLKGVHFDAFADGSKKNEYRLAGGAYNERTCPPGRPAVLSRGYGKHRRLLALIQDFEVADYPCQLPEWKAIYQERGPAAIIHMPLTIPFNSSDSWEILARQMLAMQESGLGSKIYTPLYGQI